jgi:hypothetical protein
MRKRLSKKSNLFQYIFSLPEFIRVQIPNKFQQSYIRTPKLHNYKRHSSFSFIFFCSQHRLHLQDPSTRFSLTLLSNHISSKEIFCSRIDSILNSIHKPNSFNLLTLNTIQLNRQNSIFILNRSSTNFR